MNVEPICPGCRIRRRLLSTAGADALFVDSSLLPAHLRNCPARWQFDLHGIAFETFLDLSRALEIREIPSSPEFVILDRPW